MTRLPLCALVGPATALLLACAPQLSDMRMGTPRPARVPDCELDIVAPTELATLNKYEQVGVVRLGNAVRGTDPLAPEVKAIVRPRACALGGEAISVMGSGDITSRNGLNTTAYAMYLVWAKKPVEPATPRKF